jgi:hypothetical protein
VTQGLTPGGPAALVEDLTRRAEAATPPVPYRLNPESSIIARVERNDESLVTHNLERWLPEPNRNRGTATLFDPSDYVAYVTRLADGYTTVWGNETHGHLQIGYRLVRPDLVKRQAFADIRNTVADGTKDKNIAVLLGAAPQPVPAQH